MNRLPKQRNARSEAHRGLRAHTGKASSGETENNRHRSRYLEGYDFTVDAPLRPLRAMRVKCLECCCNNSAEVRRCHMTDCPLWPFRMGRNPNRAGMGNREGSFRKSSPGSINDSGSNSPEEG